MIRLKGDRVNCKESDVVTVTLSPLQITTVIKSLKNQLMFMTDKNKILMYNTIIELLERRFSEWSSYRSEFDSHIEDSHERTETV